jgi:hypothetical protein
VFSHPSMSIPIPSTAVNHRCFLNLLLVLE